MALGNVVVIKMAIIAENLKVNLGWGSDKNGYRLRI